MRSLVTICFLFCLWQVGVSQDFAKASIGKVKLRNQGPVLQNGIVKGYYHFYNLEKKDRKNNTYLLGLSDENLRGINSVQIVRPSSYLLIDASFNGEAFGFLFYDMKDKKLELLSYDKGLKEGNKVIKEIENKYTNATYAYVAQGHEPMQSYLLSVPGKGFLYYGIKESSKSDFEIEFFDNTMKRGWVTYAPEDKYDFENATEAFQDEQFVGTVVYKRTSVFSTDLEMDLLIQNVSDGKTVFRVPMQTSKYKLMLTAVHFDKTKQQFLVYGEYFNKDQNIIKEKSLGFTTVTLDMKGAVVSEKTNSWKDDINKLVAAKDKALYDDTDILIHDFVRTSDNQTFAIGEQYKRTGVPMMAQQIKVYNMVILEFDNAQAIKKIHILEKDKNSMGLPAGMLIASSKMLGYIVKAYGGFDYQFTQTAPDRSKFVVTYINYDKEKGEKSKNVLGSIIYTPEKTFAVDKLPLNRKSTAYYVYPAKDGYVMVSEYFEKELRLDNRLEKLNY